LEDDPGIVFLDANSEKNTFWKKKNKIRKRYDAKEDKQKKKAV
jgi:hypothetical protein